MKFKQRGFTLLEILLVVGIIAILAGIVIIAINPGRQLAQVRNMERRSDIKQIKNAMEQYYIDNGFFPASTTNYTTLTEICDTATSTYPSSADCTDLIDLSELVPVYITAIPKDPTATSTAGYQVMKDINRRIIITVPEAELGVVISIGTSTATTTASLIPTDGLVAYWSLNANTINAVFSDNNYSPDNFTTSGGWSVSNTNFTDTYGYSVKYVPAGLGSEWAQWDFTVPISGQYNVYATWNALFNRGSNVPYTITHDGGTASVTADQKTSHPFFSLIGGPYNFTAGQNYYVMVTNNANGIVIADAIRIAPVGNSIACSEPTNCPSEVSGVSAKALSFTGNINSGTPTKGLIAGNINIENDITLSAWIYPTEDQNSMIISKLPVNTQWALRDVNNKIVLRGGSATSVTSSSSLIPNQWYHVVGIIEGTVGTIYINGVFDKTGALSAIGNDDTYIAIGDEKTTGVAAGYPFFGTIDEVRIYNRALTSEEIMTIYNEDKP